MFQNALSLYNNYITCIAHISKRSYIFRLLRKSASKTPVISRCEEVKEEIFQVAFNKDSNNIKVLSHYDPFCRFFLFKIDCD